MRRLWTLWLWVSAGLSALAAAATLPAADGGDTARRPKVAVVLSGGGAKGAAHIGALRVIEQADIPIDCIVGTSMGALIGALYSVGYTTDQLDSLLCAQDWKSLLSDREMPENRTLDERLQTESYAISIPFQASNPELANGGLIKGVNLSRLFHLLLYPYNTPIASFDSLPIPFACVAVDIASGKVHEFHDGSLEEAMRASMSFPAIFTPVRSGEHVFVDGGIMNNYPMDIAKKMDADIIIGVDVQADPFPAQELRGIDKVLSQVIDVATNNDYYAKIDSTDIYIKVDVTGYSAASFTAEAIDTLTRRGERAAWTKWNDLMRLRKELTVGGRDHAPARRARRVYTYEEIADIERTSTTHLASALRNSFAESSVGLSARYDNLEKVSLLLGLHLKLPIEEKDLFLTVKGRLGNRSLVATRLNWNVRRDLNLNVGYLFEHSEADLYTGHHRTARLSYRRHRTHAEFLNRWHRYIFQVGAAYDYTTWDGLMTQGIHNGDVEYITYYARALLNTLDDLWYPRRGHKLEGKCQYFTTNGVDYSGHQAAYAIGAHYMQAWSMNRNVVFMPHVGARFLRHAPDELYLQRNFLGGMANGDIFDGQFTLCGLTDLQAAADALAFTGLDIRGRISKNQFAILGGDILEQAAHAENLLEQDPSWGIRLGYIYKTLIGPISCNLHYSDLTERVNVLVNIGFVF